MKKEVKIGGLALGLIVLVGISFVLYKNGLMNYLIITGTFSVICAIVLVNTLLTTRSDEAQYKSKLRQILRTYDSILVKSKNLPKLDNLNIIFLSGIPGIIIFTSTPLNAARSRALSKSSSNIKYGV